MEFGCLGSFGRLSPRPLENTGDFPLSGRGGTMDDTFLSGSGGQGPSFWGRGGHAFSWPGVGGSPRLHGDLDGVTGSCRLVDDDALDSDTSGVFGKGLLVPGFMLFDLMGRVCSTGLGLSQTVCRVVGL